jgi:hypothetical protein
MYSMNYRLSLFSSTPVFRVRSSLLRTAAFLFLFLFTGKSIGFSQQFGDYRSIGSGFWNQTSIWQVFTEGSWVQAIRPPSELEDIEIFIESGTTVTIMGEYISDQNIIVKESGVLIHDGEWEEYFNFFEMHVYGRFVRAGEAEHGEFEFPNIIVHEGGVYEHNIDGGDLAYIEWLPGSILEFSGIISEMPNCFNDPVYHLNWNCPNQSSDIIINPNFSNLINIGGDLIITNTNGNRFIISSGTRTVTVNGDLFICNNCNISFNESGGTRTLVEKIEFIVNGNIFCNGIIDLQRRLSGRVLGNYFFVGGHINLFNGYIFSSSSHNSDRIIYLFGGHSSEFKVHKVYEILGFFGSNIKELILESFNILDLSDSLGFKIDLDVFLSNYGLIKGNDTLKTKLINHYPDALLSPGNSIGNMVIDGNLDAFGGNILIQIDGQKNDSLVILGQAYFEGGEIMIEDIGEGMISDFPYSIIFYEGLDTGDPNFQFPILVFPTQDSLYTYEWQENRLIVIKEESFLPVSLLSFTAQASESNVILEWLTASETDSDYFLLERRGEAGVWEGLAKIKAKGFSQTLQKYQYTDYALQPGRYYYRLNQLDYSGISNSYNPVSVLIKATTAIEVYPTVFSEGIWVALHTMGEREFSLHNLSGALFHLGKWNRGLHWLPLGHLPSGSYILELRGIGAKESMKLWKP